MRHRRTLPCLAVSALCLTGPAVVRVAASVPPPDPAVARSVGRWIADLDAADPAVRNGATDALVEHAGPAARPAVIAALPAASPEAAGHLLDVLLRTDSWDVPVPAELGRPPPPYDRLPPDDRAACVARLTPADAADPLVHVLMDDPSPAVRWAAANALRLSFDVPTDAAGDTPPLAARILALADAPADAAAYPPPSRNGPLLAAAAWACRATDPARADAQMGRALAIEVAHPSSFLHGADFAFLWAADRAVDRNDYPAAAALFRQLADRTPWTDDERPEPDPVGDLFALQAEHGPLPGFADDVRQFRASLVRPELIYCLARMADRQGGATGVATGAVLDAAALVAGGTSVRAHCAVGLFLFHHGWTAAGERELQGCLWLSGADPSPDVYFALHSVASECDDDAAAGKYLEGALRRSGPGGMTLTTRYGQTIAWSEADAWAEVHWHYLRVAVTAGDRDEALTQARQLLDLDADGQVLKHDPGMAADVVPVLADAGRRAEADRCFKAAYAALEQQVKATPTDPMPRNNLAWLCARSDRHLDEADRLSADAVRLAPGDAACLDTRAEVLVRRGRPREALALEELALSIKPEDLYMQRQLARFKAAAAATRPSDGH